MMKTTLLTTFLALASLSSSSSQVDAKALLRGERSLENYGNNNHNDNHGCIGSAGYSWCASLNECLRPFETTCPPPSHDAHGCPAGAAFCAYTRLCQYPGTCYAGNPVIIPGGDVDQYGCRASAGLSWCAASQTCEMYGYCLSPVVNNPGSDRDQYGCIGSAGYTWCDSLQECIRTFDTVCPPLTPPVNNPGVPGGDVVDQYGCRASAGYSYCPSSQTCERYYDCRDNQPDGDVDAYGCRPSAGYSWCASRNQCIRSWETECFVPMDGGDVDIWGCRPSTGYSYCAYTEQCERPGVCENGGLCPPIYDPVCCVGQAEYNSGFCEAERAGYSSQDCVRGLCVGGISIPPFPPVYAGHHGGITGTGGGAVNGGGGSCR